MSIVASNVTTRHMTYAEFLKTDFEARRVEWVNGEAVEIPPVGNEHSALQVWISACVANFVMQKESGEVRGETFQMKTGPTLPGRIPDLLFVLSANSKRLKKNHLQGPADLAVEIVSPDGGIRDRP